MNFSVIAPTLSGALEELKKLVAKSEAEGRRTVVFCEDRLTLVAERAVCAEVGGTFLTSVYTLARFLSSERGTDRNILSSQGSAMAIRGIIERNRDRLKLFGRLSAAASARSVYDTIALLYSSGIGADDIEEAEAPRLLKDKLGDIALIYRQYNQFLDESGRLDRNMYLRLLPPVIEKSAKIIGADVVFLGFQAFTGTVSHCVKACIKTADNCYGLFVGGAPDIYANEAGARFEAFAMEYGGVRIKTVKSDLIPEAECIRCGLFEPASYFSDGLATGRVHVFEAESDGGELEFIAASIKKFVHGGMRYAKISVMLPGVAAYSPTLERVFSQYEIPYYLDERRALSEHPFTSFLCDFLECVAGGCATDDVLSVLSCFLFGGISKEEKEGAEHLAERRRSEQRERDIYRNYVLRCANWRGGVKRAPREDICKKLGFDFSAVCTVRQRFVSALSLLPAGKASSSQWAQAVRSLAEFFRCREQLEELSSEYADMYPARAEFNARAYDGVMAVVDEIEELGLGDSFTAREYKKLLSSGFAAAEIALIPPKADAVFVGDISSTVNAGSEVVFAAGLTDAVPPAGSDTALLTDRELASLEKVNLKISPKISQVDRRRRETVALNLCAFRQHLYLTYPVMQGREEKVRSEIVAYILKMFRNSRGGQMVPITQKALDVSGRANPYYCSELVPALKALAGGRLAPRESSALYAVLKERGQDGRAAEVIRRERPKESISSGKKLFAPNGFISPTLLETYFACPYKNFAERGLKLAEREEGAVRPLDTGNFIHTVLQRFAAEIESVADEKQAAQRGGDIAQSTLEEPQYSFIGESAGGKYTAERLVGEARMVCVGVYRQIACSSFTVRDVEKWYNLPVGGVKAGGKIDRVDSFGDMVRIVDYKTGSTDVKPSAYYFGTKLQLPFYLLAASQGKRPVGAYYFPANIDYSEKGATFAMEGFMDQSEDSVRASDTSLADKGRSRFVNGVLSGRKPAGNLPAEDFPYFLDYSALIARKGAEEMFGGNIAPSPYGETCDYCKMRGMCAYPADAGARGADGITCADISALVRKIKGDE